MQSLWSIYHCEIPAFILEMANTPAMLRLKGVGMHCGCEYASLPQYTGAKPYSRWVHSVGVALIVWHFTGDRTQTVAGLLHDIASPAFAHAVDFLHGDYIAQESTEDETEAIISGSAELKALLAKYGLTVAEVCDYHMYPVADNDSPRLSADRLEYTLGNALGLGQAEPDELRAIYEDLVIAQNEEGQPELQFRSETHALRFAQLSLTNSRIYSCDGNRFVMQALADILRAAVEKGALAETDLYSTEADVIRRLESDAFLAARWAHYTQYANLRRSDTRPADGYWVNIDAKRRHIDPMVAGAGRVTALCPEYAKALNHYRSESYDYWITAEI